MRQNINLLPGVSAGATPVAARVIVGVLVVALLFAGAVGAGLSLRLAGEEARLADLQANRDSLRREVARLSAERPERDPAADEAALQALERQLTAQRAFLAELDPHADPLFQGFAAVLAGLARTPVNGLWLRELHVGSDGRMTLYGSATDPVLVPRFVEGLRAQPVFQGRDFTALRLERRADRVDFELDGGRTEP